MVWLLAFIGLITVVILMRRLFSGVIRPVPPPVIAPDDDPDFLWKLESEQRRQRLEKDSDDDTAG